MTLVTTKDIEKFEKTAIVKKALKIRPFLRARTIKKNP